tara:strand:+ start:663 stop:794 length:132 start_codon:yes stop_codon:yes gene_type:complete
MSTTETSSALFKDTIMAYRSARLVNETGDPALMGKNSKGDLID